jgi:hypothetical protein
MLKANDLEIGKMSKARLIPWRHRKFTPPLFRKYSARNRACSSAE